MTDKLEKLQSLLKLVDESITRKEFEDNFKVIIDLIKKLKSSNQEVVDGLDTKYNEVITKLSSNLSSDINDLKSEAMTFIINETRKIKSGKDGKDGKQGKDGKDADEELITSKVVEEVLKVVPKIEDIENDLPKLGEPIRDALELLPDGEKLEIKAIQDLEERLEELKNTKGVATFVGTNASSVLGDPVTIAHGGTNSTTAEFTPTTNAVTLNYYVALTGSDSNDGLTALTPFLTVKKALDSVPLLMGRVYQINIATGVTYSLTEKYTFRSLSSAYGDTDWGGKVIIYGDPTTPANVVINGLNTSTVAFEVEDKAVAAEFNGVSIANCSVGIVANNARVIIKNTSITFNTQGIQASYGAQVTVPSGNTGLTLTSDGLNTGATGILSTVGSSVILQSPVTITGIKGVNALGMQALLNSNINIITNTTITAEATTGARLGFLASQGGQILISGGTHSISNILQTSSSSLSAAIAVQTTSRLQLQGSPTINFTNCVNAWMVSGRISEVAGATYTYNYTTVTNKVKVYHGAVIDSTNYLNATGDITYLEMFNTQNIFGYDDRYVKTALSVTGGTLGSVAFFDANGKITQDNTNFFWDNINKRFGLGGITSPSYPLDVKGAINSQSTPGIAPYNNITYANFVAENEYNDYPSGKFLIGQTSSDINISLVVAPLFTSAGTNKPASLVVSTNKSGVEATSYQLYFRQSTTLSEIITLNRSAATGAGAATPLAFSIGTGTTWAEKMRLTSTGLGIGTTSPAYNLDVNGTSNFTGFTTALQVTAGYFAFGNSVLDAYGVNMSSPKSFFNIGADTHGSGVFTSNVYIKNDSLYIANTHSTIAGSVLKIPGNGKTNQGAFVFYTAPPGAVTADAAYGGVLRFIIGSGGLVGVNTVATQQFQVLTTTKNFSVYAQSTYAGTGTDEFSNAQAANYGEYIATTTGHIIGQAGYAAGGNRSYGGLFRAIVSKNSAANIGCAGYALNAGTSPTQIGGYFALLNAAPTLTSAALLCDNGTQTDPIFVAKDNGTTVFRVLDGGYVELSSRILKFQGTDIASASTITLGSGNSFELTGTTAVDLISSTGWQEGSEITLIANESVTINHGTATSGSNITIKLAGSANFNMTADDVLTLILSSTTAGGQAWREKSRTVI